MNQYYYINDQITSSAFSYIIDFSYKLYSGVYAYSIDGERMANKMSNECYNKYFKAYPTYFSWLVLKNYTEVKRQKDQFSDDWIWLYENIKNDFTCKSSKYRDMIYVHFYFKNKEDAMMFKLSVE